ncbi:MAG: Lrp/AsnC family transcriptional regulator [Gammaproteobacteria bacterium]|nr:Lrp/AsnC family transcriptional regulator [Gammaproteobacteria bacterium]MDE0178243.1 Lrp/AsnC family transcriptional regulator [Gammaproteobacteria bacterium]MDE0444140.1 Lrp/AsnC family transcriptional regulator [Gammaproteobacteria bacterium]
MSSKSPGTPAATVTTLDPIDRRILVELQDSADMSMQELGERVGLSHTPCWRRVRRLERDGIITRRVALLDAKQLGLAVDVFVNVNLRRHQENALTRFEEAVQDVPEIVECYTVSGETDFLLRVVVSDVGAYERLLKATLVHLPEVGNLTSTFALRQVKYTTALPLSR